MSKSNLLTVGSVYKEECVNYMKNLVQFAIECCGLDSGRSFNRVDIKKSILNSTRGRSLTKFVQTLSIDDRKNLLNLSSMECPVICPTKKVILPPVESMPSNIMKSSKKLRNFFGIPELQVCRGCVKKGRCRRYQQIERDIPDLSDLASVMIGMYTICKIHLDGNELVIPEFAFKELKSVSSILSSLNKYFKDFNIQTNIPRGDDKACIKQLQKSRKELEMKKLELLKEKVFNIPTGYNIIPKKTTYMASFQRDLYNKLYKKKKPIEDDYIWVSDTNDISIPEENSKLEKINRAEIDLKDTYIPPVVHEIYSNTNVNTNNSINSSNSSVIEFDNTSGIVTSNSLHNINNTNGNNDKVKKIEDLSTNDIQFRMEYSKPLGTEINLNRYDVMNNRIIEGIKINSKGRYIIDLESNLSNKQNNNNIEYKNDGISMYKIPNSKKIEYLSKFIENLGSCPNNLSFLKTVPYNYKCQSSGEIINDKTQLNSNKIKEKDNEDLIQLALALDTNNK